ncbi:MAG: hypothetical protein Q6363_004155, partial [Candidatus Njordarchaeota archaeon]
MKRPISVLIIFLAIVGFSLAPMYNARIDAILATSEVVIKKTGTILDIGFRQELPSIWVSEILAVNTSRLEYPSSVDRALVEEIEWEIEKWHASKLALIIAALGITSDDRALDDPAIVITIERAQYYYARRGYQVFVAVGEEASVETLVAFIIAAEKTAREYVIYGVSHGVLGMNVHGVVLYSELDGATVVNLDILRNMTGMNEARKISEFIWVACNIGNELDEYKDSAFVTYFQNAPFFRIYGKGETYIPQDVIDLFDSAVLPYRESYAYPVAIINGTNVEAGELNVTIEVSLYVTTLQTNTTLKFGRKHSYKRTRHVKGYTVRVKVQARKGRSLTKSTKDNYYNNKMGKIYGFDERISKKIREKLARKNISNDQESEQSDQKNQSSQSDIDPMEQLIGDLNRVVGAFVKRTDA